MANFWSDQFTTAYATLPAVPVTADSGLIGSRMRYKNARFIVAAADDLADDDVLRWFSLNSNDRPIHLYGSSDADWGATTSFNMGLYLPGGNHDGAVVDEDLYASAVDWSGAIARVDYLTEAALADVDRGKRVWEHLGLTEDPVLEYEFAFTFASNPSATAAEVEMFFEMIYVSGS